MAASGNGHAAKFVIQDLSFYYGRFKALNRVSFAVPRERITAIIGPSGCGKSTLLQVFNRMYDLVPGTRVRGSVRMGDDEITTMNGLQDLRRRVGMVFQRPNPFPMSIYDNVAYGARLLGWTRAEIDAAVEESLRLTALWDDVSDRLGRKAGALSGGQQQRLCIARCLAVRTSS